MSEGETEREGGNIAGKDTAEVDGRKAIRSHAASDTGPHSPPVTRPSDQTPKIGSQVWGNRETEKKTSCPS